MNREDVLEEIMETLKIARKVAKASGSADNLIGTSAVMIELLDKIDNVKNTKVVGFTPGEDGENV